MDGKVWRSHVPQACRRYPISSTDMVLPCAKIGTGPKTDERDKVGCMAPWGKGMLAMVQR
jgi:hypothetical protein